MNKKYGRGIGFWTGLVLGLLFILLSLLRAQDWKDSGALFHDLMDQYPNEPIAYNNLGMYLYEKGDEDAAMPYFDKALEINPNMQAPLMNRASHAFKQKDYDTALGDLNRYIFHFPNDVRGYGARGGVLAEIGRTEEAIADMEQAKAMDKNSLDAYRNLGKLYTDIKEYQQAADNYGQYLSFYPDHEEINYLKGVLEEKLGNYKGSIYYISKAIGANPDNGRYYMSRAKAYYLTEQKDKAVNDFRKAEGLGVKGSAKFRDLLGIE